MKCRFTLSVSLILTISIVVFTPRAQNPTSPAPIREKTVNSAETEKIKQNMVEALKIIEENYAAGKKLDYNALFKGSIMSMLLTLDPHSNYLDPKETEEFNSSLQAQYFGIGFLIAPSPEGIENPFKTYVRTTFENSPARRAGLRYGDRIIEINGVSMQGKSINEVRGNVLGPRGTLVKIVVERSGKRQTFEIIRDAIALPSIPIAYIIRPEIGYIAMTNRFSETTFGEFQKALANLKGQGMKYLVLDLRNNIGGLAEQARLVASVFLPRGTTIYTEKKRAGKPEKRVSENDSPDKTPLVVLINRFSVSSAEILAGALQDNDRALFVGETTYGKGLIQRIFKTENNTTLLLTTGKYETPSGRLIQRQYSSGSLYEYYREAGNFSRENETNKGAEYKTRSGRIIYGGGGIKPDIAVKSAAQSAQSRRIQNDLNNPIIAFSINLASGNVPGFESFKVERPIVFNYDLKSSDFPISDELYQAFRKFAAEKYKIYESQTDAEREYVVRSLRVELVTAAYGTNTPLRIFNEYDDQLKKAIEILPLAKQFAAKSLQGIWLEQPGYR